MLTFKVAKTLGWSQRRVLKEMDADEVIDWMVYDLACDPEYMEKMNNEPLICNNAVEESNAVRALLMGLGSKT